jgi:GTP-binding protein
MTISAAAHTNTRELMYRAAQLLKELPAPAPLELETAIPVIKLEEDVQPFSVTRDAAGAWHVSGKQVERLALRHRFDSEESLMAFQRAVEKLGVLEALRKAGVEEGDTVWIGEDYELEWQD